MNSLWETVTTPLRFFRSEASEETIMETVTTPLRFFRSEAPEETIMETVITPLRFSTSEVPEETTIRESEEPEEQEIPAPLELSVNLISEDLSAQFISKNKKMNSLWETVTTPLRFLEARRRR